MDRRIVNVHKREYVGKDVINTRRVERTLRLIVFLSEWHTIKECAVFLNVSQRSIQRYFKMLIGFGFDIVTNRGRFYVHRIVNIREYFKIE